MIAPTQIATVAACERFAFVSAPSSSSSGVVLVLALLLVVLSAVLFDVSSTTAAAAVVVVPLLVDVDVDVVVVVDVVVDVVVRGHFTMAKLHPQHGPGSQWHGPSPLPSQRESMQSFSWNVTTGVSVSSLINLKLHSVSKSLIGPCVK